MARQPDGAVDCNDSLARTRRPGDARRSGEATRDKVALRWVEEDAPFLPGIGQRLFEFGLVGETMHKVDEKSAVDDLRTLSRVYETVLDRYFAA